MRHVTIGPALPDRSALDVEIARLRDLDIRQLRARWHISFENGRPLTSLATFCIASSHIGYRRINWVTWTASVSGSSIARDLPR